MILSEPEFMRTIKKYAHLCIMKARLNLTIDEQLLVSIKKIAEKRNISISEMVTDFFKKLVQPIKRKNIIDLIEQLEQPSIPPGIDLKELYHKEQREKYSL
jgi:hypothetical protein